MDADIAPLHRALAAQRQHVLGILDGLDDEAMRRAVLPSGWTPVGVVNHLALDVERFWFLEVMAGQPRPATGPDAAGGDAWVVDAATAPQEVLARYRRACALADEVIASTPAGEAPKAWPHGQFPEDYVLTDLTAMTIHVVTETACHAGQLDAVRELIDGRQWLVL